MFDSVSRMSRCASEGYKDYKMLYEMGVDLVFLNEPLRNTWGVMENRFRICSPSTVKEKRMGTDFTSSNPGSSGTESFSLNFSSG